MSSDECTQCGYDITLSEHDKCRQCRNPTRTYHSPDDVEANLEALGHREAANRADIMTLTKGGEIDD